MGEVYRATDARLKREVAIKVLPTAFTDDRERLARFEREAQILAQLHHPNIASIFGIEESGGTRALVMELVEGQTLAERVAHGPVHVAEVVAIAVEIAQALEAAHEKGIVHRDLKPQNIKIAPDGKVKVLDFGLAKAMGEAAAPGSDAGRSPTLMNSPTVTGVAGTELGTILGTAGYMAPEQARGAAIDKRVDIWSFGVVLYEMLVRERLFQGESVVDTLSAVMRKEIDFARLPADTPRRLLELLRRCLERNPKNRLHDIADARVALDELVRGVPDPYEASATVQPVATRRRPGLAGVALLALVALAAGFAVGRALSRPKPGSFDTARWALALPEGLALASPDYPQLGISADGHTQVAAVSDSESGSQLLVRTTSDPEARLLPDSAGAVSPFLSPDGAWIGFVRGEALYKMPVAGGPPVELAAVRSANVSRGGTWGRDGYIYFVSRISSGLQRVSENGGAVTQVTELDEARDERSHRWPQALPDGDAVIFTSDTFASIEYYDDARIEAVRPATGERKTLVEGASFARYSGGGRLVFARGGALYAVDFDPKTLSVRGSPEVVLQGVATSVGSGAVQFASAEGGAAVWAPGGKSSQFSFYWVDRAGVEAPVRLQSGPFNEGALSPDGERLALVGGPDGTGDLWVADLARDSQTRLTNGEVAFNPAWSPDGSEIAYVTRAPKPQGPRVWQLSKRRADGSSEPEVLIESRTQLTTSCYTPDGTRLLYSQVNDSGTASDLFVLPLGGERKPELLLGGPGLKTAAEISPDGRYVAYVDLEGEQGTVFVRPFPAGEGRWQISAPDGFEPHWSRDGSELFYRTVTGTMYRVPLDRRNGLGPGRPERLFDRVSIAGVIHTYGVSPDGRRFLTPRSLQERRALRTLHLDLGFQQRIARHP